MLHFIETYEPIKISDLVKGLENYTSYSLKKDVKYLVEEAKIKKVGKGTIYVFNQEN